MFSIINYFSAKRRLEESKKTILMMGGEDECQPMLLGQRDFLELEVLYHKKEMILRGIFYSILTVVGISSYFYFYH